MKAREANVELLLGRMVHDAAGRRLGRLEEIRAVVHDGELRVSQYLVGRHAMAVRLTTASLLPRVAHLLRLGTRGSGYVIPWSWMDLSDPEHPRCTHPLEDLPDIRDEEPPHPPL